METSALNIDNIPLTNVKQCLDEYIKAFKDKYKSLLERDNKIATRQLIDNFDAVIVVNGYNINVNLHVADYYWYVENGRKPGKFPPVAAIRKWIDDKPVIPRPDKNGKLPSKDSLAYLIGRKIAKDGIKAGHQLRDTKESLNQIYMTKLTEALQKDFDEVFSVKVLDQINKMIKI